MTISRVKPAGWGFGEVFTSPQATQIDENIVKAPDFVDGGTYAPTNPVIVGGDGLSLTGGTHEVAAAATLTIAGTGTLNNEGTISNAGDIVSGGAIILNNPTKILFDAVRTVTRREFIPFWNPAKFAYQLGALSDLGAAADVFSFLMRLPHGATLKTVRMYLSGATPHGALPTMPSMRCYAMNLATGALTSIFGVTTDASASVAAYEAQHFIEKTGLSHTVDAATYHYLVQVTAETGGSGLAGAFFYGVEWTVEVADMGDGVP